MREQPVTPASDTAPARDMSGLYAGLSAYLLWGLMPVYLKLFEGIGAAAVLAHRVFWSAILLAAVTLILRKTPALLRALKNVKLLLWLLFSATMIGLNWYLYTWAVLNERVLDTSLGYFIQPILNTALGVILLGETMGKWRIASTILALAGIALMTVANGGLPLISLGLALAFALYSYARNRADVDALTGLFIETAFLAPVALWWLEIHGGGIFSQAPTMTLLLIGSGIATSIPLALFGHAARRVTLTTLGFMQYIAPSTVFLLGAFVYDEPLSASRLGAFALIWLGLLVFSIGGFRRRQRLAKAG
ncbi:EamA family transporter RarD [Pacificimonas sp. ICDLI1SI03]